MKGVAASKIFFVIAPEISGLVFILVKTQGYTIFICKVALPVTVGLPAK